MNSVFRFIRTSVLAIFAMVLPAVVLAQTVPYFTGQPYNQNIYEGQNASFYVATDAIPDATYQWQRLPFGSATWSNLSDTGAYAGTTWSQLAITGATLAMSGDQVRCVATNTAGTAISSPATITVTPAVAPVVADLPPGVTVDIGNYFSLYADIYGAFPMTLQWKKDGVAIAGATSYIYSVSSATATDGGQYTLTATNPAGTTTSTAVAVTVNPASAPLIYGQPAGITLDTGAILTIFPSVAGTQPMTFQWQKDGVAIAGATSRSYSANNVTTADSGQYTLTATNQVGTVTSAAIPVTVVAPVAPTITGLNPGYDADYGTSIGFNATVFGTQPITYQWKKDGVDIPGAISNAYSVPSATTADSGSYTLTATNQVGSTTSTPLLLTVNPAVAPKIVFGNSGIPVTPNYGESLSLYAQIFGTQPMTYQWSKDGVAIPGATSYSYYVNSVTSADSGSYTLTATNQVGTVTSDPILVAVNPPVLPTISGMPTTTTLAYGDNFSLYPYVNGTAPITFQWKKDGVAITGATSSYYFKDGMTTADSGQYTLEATNQAGTTTRTVQVTVNAPVAPQISGLPSFVALNYGDYLYLTPNVNGTPTITYQWKKDGVAIAGGASSSYSVYGVSSADSGSYTLTATNQQGTVTSNTVTVTVNPAVAPAILNLPAGVTLDVGGYLSLSPSITGTGPMTFQWKKDGVAIDGATSNYYYMSNVTTAANGQYTLTVTNQVGTTSAAIVVTVNPAIAPIIFGLPSTVTLTYGGYLTFSPTIAGTGPLTYQWNKDGTPISGAVNGYYYNYNATPADSGQYTLTVTNQAGTTTSAAIAVTVNPQGAPQLFNLSPNSTLNYGDTLSLSANVSATGPVTFQWKKDGVELAGQTSTYYYKYGVTSADAGQYTLTATNAAGTVTSSSITVAVNPAIAPTIVRQPIALVTYQGLTANFNVTATGTGPLAYQWSFNGQPIPSSNYPTLTVANVQAADAGDYTVVVTNVAGSATSNAAALSLSTLGAAFASAGSVHSLFIKSNGELWAMGDNSFGQLGDGTKSSRANAVQVATGVVAAAAGADHSLYIKSDKTLWGMGDNSLGQLGDGTSVGRFTPVQIASGVVWASAGQYHSLFIKDDGTLWAMGGNFNGQLGDGTGTTRTTPVQIASGVVWASAGAYHSLFVKADGTFWAMGANSDGQLGDGAASYQSAVPEQIATGVISASAGAYHSLFVKSDGTLWAMGANSNGQLGVGAGTWSLSAPAQIATGVVSASAGGSHSLYVKSDGTLWAMGANYNGQLGDGTTNYQSVVPEQIATGVVSASAGSSFSLFLSSTGTLWAAGSNYNGQLGDGTSNYQSLVPDQVATGTVATPTAPTAVSASDGTLANAVLVTWNPVAGATGYGVWRGTTNSSAAATKIASNVPLALYYDTTAVAGTTYYYWVKATNEGGTSTFSGSNTGFSTGTVAGVSPFSDFNGDGKSDIFWTNTTTGVRSIWLMNGATPSSYASLGAMPLPWTVLSPADFNGDGKADLFWTNTTTGERSIWLMNGTAASASVSLGVVPLDWTIDGLADFNGDGKADVFWTNSTTGVRSIWLMNGTAPSSYVSLGVMPLAWRIDGLADFDGDGKADIFWTNTTTGERSIWLMNGTVPRSSVSLGVVPLDWAIDGLADFDGDGKADVFWTNGTSGARSIWLMNGMAPRSYVSLGVVPPAWTISFFADFNGDGKADIFWTNTTTGERSIWLMNGTAALSSVSLGVLSLDWTSP